MGHRPWPLVGALILACLFACSPELEPSSDVCQPYDEQAEDCERDAREFPHDDIGSIWLSYRGCYAAEDEFTCMSCCYSAMLAERGS